VFPGTPAVDGVTSDPVGGATGGGGGAKKKNKKKLLFSTSLPRTG